MILNGKYMNTRKVFQSILVAICLISILILPFIESTVSRTQGMDIDTIKIQAYDGEIKIQWDSFAFNNKDIINIRISDGESITEKEVSSRIGEYSFKEGSHGVLYTVIATAKYKDGTIGASYEKQVLYLDYNKLPDLPLLIIDTRNEEEPTYTEAVKSDDTLWGDTITNNKYVFSLLTVESKYQNATFQASIRVRGNSSSVFSDKKSYKIKLEEAVDLLDMGSEYASKEWILLNAGADLKTYIGSHVSELCGMEWQPNMRFVNVILNGDWKGCYYLTEPVNQDVADEYVSDSGFIFENDPYFWNSDDIYFKTTQQIYQMGYTFKYPEISYDNDVRLMNLQAYMQEFESCVMNDDSNYKNYIDEDTFASWILARDILGQYDAAGSNMYFYKYDFDLTNPTSTKVKMGPLWDFDSAFLLYDEWASIHNSEAFIFPQLFEQESFEKSYVERWKNVSASLADDIDTYMEELYEEQGEAIDESWKLDAVRWSYDVTLLSEQMNQASEWFEARTAWMNCELGLE